MLQKEYATFRLITIGFTIQTNNFTDELGGILLIIGLLLIAFSKEKDEDERISRVRLESLLWATLVNSILLIFCILFSENNVIQHLLYTHSVYHQV